MLNPYSELLGGNFSVILADPPWRYKNQSPTTRHSRKGMTPEYFYQTLSLDEIKAIPVRKMAGKNSVLFLWATCPMMPEALEVMSVWGWKYKTIVTWEKSNIDCMGYWFRVATEHLLVGISGDVKSFRSMQRNIVRCGRGRHSAKPEQFHELIEATCKPPMLELFGRRKRKGWTVFGNEVTDDLYV